EDGIRDFHVTGVQTCALPIYPTKTEIKFEDEYAIYAVLRSAVKHALGQFNVAPSLDFDQNPDWAFIPSRPQNKEIKSPEIRVDRNFNPFENKPSQNEIKPVADFYKSFSEFEIENNHPESLLSKEEFELNDFKVIQWQNKYLVTEFKEDLLIIDQHRAHQLILFEKFKEFGKGNALSQRLLFPVEISSNSNELQLIKNAEIELIRFGFDVDFTDEKLLVNAIPTELTTEQVPDIFSDLLKELDLHQKVSLEKEIPKIMAKNSAIRKGEKLLPEQARHLAQQLLQLDEPNFSPFGKRIFVQLHENEIFKKLN